MAESPPPEYLGKYKIESVLGRGAMGVVYRALDPIIDRVVALKVMHTHLCQGDEGEAFLQRFRQEAQAAARCLHPNIVTVFDFGSEQEDMPYLIMELVEGNELRDLLDKPRAFSIQEAIDIVLPVLAALQFAHDHGVVHRDIKPANIIVLKDGGVKVADFGVARIDTSELTGIGYMVGTPSYMSPEGLQGIVVDGRSDLYSTGLVLLELVTGKRPHLGYLQEFGVHQRITEAGLAGDKVLALADILEKSLNPSPEQRYQTGKDFSNALVEWLATSSVADHTRVAPIKRPHIPNHGQTTDQPHMTSSVAPEMLHVMKAQLVRFVGPMAGRLVEKAYRSGVDANSMIVELARYIPSDAERGEFMHSLRQSGIREATYLGAGSAVHTPANESGAAAPSSQLNTFELNEEQRETIAKELAFYLGPLASRVVRSTAATATSLDQLYQALAEHIPTEQDRQKFLAIK